jgi:sialate O-acetylesterase
MALPLLHTFSRNISMDAINAGKYSNIRITGQKQNMNVDQAWSTLAAAVQNDTFFHFSSTCYYFGESLTDKLNTAGGGNGAPPIGLIHTAYGGSMIEAWTTKEATAACVGTAQPSQVLWDTSVVPYLDTTVKGWVWYQGENNCNGVMGNSLQGIGYGCQLPTMVKLWRSAWSKTVGTTDPVAPFGVVTLASGGSEGGSDIGGMRWSQTANYGSLPAPEMPNTFLAHAYDLGDPWQNSFCQAQGCCWQQARGFNATKCGGLATKCVDACKALTNTSFYMGPIHPRIKKPVGERLAFACSNLVYGGTGAVSGPTIAGCSVVGTTIEVKFNASLLKGGSVGVKPYTGNAAAGSAMKVLVDKRFWCENTVLTAEVDGVSGLEMCIDAGAPNYGRCGLDQQCGAGNVSASSAISEPLSLPKGNAVQAKVVPAALPAQAWVEVDIKLGAAGSNTVLLDLAKLNGATPLALRYAPCAFFGRDLHSRMPLSFTLLLRLKRCHACDQ